MSGTKRVDGIALRSPFKTTHPFRGPHGLDGHDALIQMPNCQSTNAYSSPLPSHLQDSPQEHESILQLTAAGYRDAPCPAADDSVARVSGHGAPSTTVMINVSATIRERDGVSGKSTRDHRIGKLRKLYAMPSYSCGSLYLVPCTPQICKNRKCFKRTNVMRNTQVLTRKKPAAGHPFDVFLRESPILRGILDDRKKRFLPRRTNLPNAWSGSPPPFFCLYKNQSNSGCGHVFRARNRITLDHFTHA